MDLKTNIKKLYSSSGSTVVVVIVGGVVVGLLIFHAGVAYGERHAFGRMHGLGRGEPPPGFGMLSHSFIPEGHGAVGTITALASSTMTLKLRDGGTQTIYIDSDTVIHGLTPSETLTSLKVGEDIAVIGEPDEDNAGQINAKLIRVLPPMPHP
jgi:hypothetical protein